MRMVLYILGLSCISLSLGVCADAGPPEDLSKDLEKEPEEQYQAKTEQDTQKQFLEQLVKEFEIDEDVLKEYLPEEVVNNRAYLTNPNVLQYLASAIEQEETRIHATKTNIDFWTNRIFRTFIVCVMLYWLQHNDYQDHIGWYGTGAASWVLADWLPAVYFLYREQEVQKANEMCARSFQFQQLSQQLQALGQSFEGENNTDVQGKEAEEHTEESNMETRQS